jgi:hypothetical protein
MIWRKKTLGILPISYSLRYPSTLTNSDNEKGEVQNKEDYMNEELMFKPMHDW